MHPMIRYHAPFLILLAGLGCSSTPKLRTDRACLSELARIHADSKGAATTAQEDLALAGVMKVEIGSRIEARHNDFKTCYEDALHLFDRTEGRLKLQFLINSSGRVAKACVVESTYEVPDFHACMTRVIQRIQFPKPAGGSTVSVSYPFDFKQSRE